MEELEGRTPDSGDGWRNAHPTPTQHSTEKKWKEATTRLISWVKSHAPGSTHVAHEAACVPPQELGTKHIFPMAFGIILKYYAQGLKLLGSTLSLFFQPSNPQFLTQVLWKLSPPSLIHRGRSTHRDVSY
jgi:hypothetical protein